MVGWRLCLDGHELERAPGKSGGGQRSLCAIGDGAAGTVRAEHNLETEQRQTQPLRAQSRPRTSTFNVSPSPEGSRARRCHNLPVFQGMPAAPACVWWKGAPSPRASPGPLQLRQEARPEGTHGPCPQGFSASSLHTLPWLAAPDNPSVRLWALITGGSPGLPEIG